VHHGRELYRDTAFQAAMITRHVFDNFIANLQLQLCAPRPSALTKVVLWRRKCWPEHFTRTFLLMTLAYARTRIQVFKRQY